jgi:hypothetical protein
VIGLFFFGALQLFFIGIVGEYIGSIHTQVLRRPPVIEKERVNFSCLQNELKELSAAMRTMDDSRSIL